MPKAKRLIVGLGNPGAEYEGTRHNIGFAVAEAVAEQSRIPLAFEQDALLGWGSVRNCGFGVAKPLTYMNRSGLAVKKMVNRYGLLPSELLVIVDDLNLEPGRIRIRQRGSAGGHNGVQDIIDRLGTNDFPRLRIGIGNDFRRGQQAKYVLSPFAPEEQPIMEEVIVRAHEAAVTFVCEGIRAAMNRFNN